MAPQLDPGAAPGGKVTPEMVKVGLDKGSGLAVWGIGLLICVGYGLWQLPMDQLRGEDRQKLLKEGDPQTLLGLALEYWPLMALIVAVILIIAGQLGSSLGLPGLFTDPPKPDPEQERRRLRRLGDERKHVRSYGLGAAFWGAVGATLLVAQVWTVVFFSEVIDQSERFKPEHFRLAPSLGSIDLVHHFKTIGGSFWGSMATSSSSWGPSRHRSWSCSFWPKSSPPRTPARIGGGRSWASRSFASPWGSPSPRSPSSSR